MMTEILSEKDFNKLIFDLEQALWKYRCLPKRWYITFNKVSHQLSTSRARKPQKIINRRHFSSKSLADTIIQLCPIEVKKYILKMERRIENENETRN